MNEPSTKKSLDVLHRRRSPRPPAKWKNILFTVALIGGLVGLLAFVFRDRLRPAVPVEAARVLLLENGEATDSEVSEPVGATLFQASGWIEPDPWPVRVAVLTDGFVEAVFVREGEPVEQDQELARLDATDARLALDASELHRQSLEATLTAHQSSVEPVEAQLEAARARRERAEARFEEAEDTWKRIEALDDRDTMPTERIAAKRALLERRAEMSEAEAEIQVYEKRITSLSRTCDRMAADIEQADKQVEINRLALERTAIRSPMAGRVLKRFVEPGAKRMAGMDDPNSATVVSLYDPSKLQVRVDVPLAEAGRLRDGMPALISTSMIPGRSFTGEVTRIVGEADLQRNTLQAKVAIHDPDPRLRPEVLCRVEFRGQASTGDKAGMPDSSGRRHLWVPEEALAEPTAATTTVWVVDTSTQSARPVQVSVGRQARSTYRIVLDGLHANQLVVTRGWQNLSPGHRVKLTLSEKSP